MNRQIFAIIAFAIIIAIATIFNLNNKNNLPIVAIANYGPHASLTATIQGLKEQLTVEGFIENRTISYAVADVAFDPNLIPQMLTTLQSLQPKIIVAMTTPVAQFAKSKIQDIPLIFSAITDPVAAGLIKEKHQACANITGSSDLQDLSGFLAFAKTILPSAKTVGILYATAESNDLALVQMMNAAAANKGMAVLAVPIENARDVPLRMHKFKNKVDLIYVGTSGPIQPTLPAIASKAHQLGIPVFNVEEQAVRDGLALASFGVDYRAVGKNTGKLVADILNGTPISQLAPHYPTYQDHHGFINKNLADKFGVIIPKNVTVLE